jgi:hypothetical protein
MNVQGMHCTYKDTAWTARLPVNLDDDPPVESPKRTAYPLVVQ